MKLELTSDFKSSELIELDIDDYKYFYDDSLTLFQACLEKDLFLPRFCYHVKLKIVGNCRMCMIEELDAPKLLISCATSMNFDAIFFTETDLVRSGREFVLEFLLINHPLDCPVCDQGGECDLQDQTMTFGLDKGRFYENYKRSVETKNYSPLIKFLLNRCIQCTRCTRFIHDITNTPIFSLLGRGFWTEISAYTIKLLRSELSGNIIDLCPVGASTSKTYSFSLRYWEVYDVKMVDIFDTLNSLIRLDFRGLSIMRILPISSIYLDEEWITDKTRFSFDSFICQRLLAPMLIGNKFFIKISWKNLLYFIKSYFIKFINVYFILKKKIFYSNVYVGNFLDLFTFKSFKECFLALSMNTFKNTNLFFNKINDFRKNYFFKLTDLDSTFLFFLFGINLRLELPILNLKLKNYIKANELCLVFLTGFLSNLNYFYQHLGNNYIKILTFIDKNILLLEEPITIIFSSTMYKSLININKFFDLLLWTFDKLSINLFIFNLSALTSTRLFDFEENLMNRNFKENFFKIFNYSVITYNLGWDNWINNIKKCSKKKLFIYQGHHADYSMIFANIILPAKFFYEKSVCFISLIGLVSNFAYNSFKYKLLRVKADNKIFDLFGEIFKTKKLFNLRREANSLLTISYEQFFFLLFYKYDYLKLFFLHKFIIFYKNFFSLINDYYLTDAISRNSIAMRLCSKILTYFTDFKYITCFYISYNKTWYY